MATILLETNGTHPLSYHTTTVVVGILTGIGMDTNGRASLAPIKERIGSTTMFRGIHLPAPASKEVKSL